MKTLMLEFYKIKRRKIGLTMAAYLIAQFLWGLWALHDPTPQAQAQGFLSLLYYISVLDAVMVPPIMAVLASRLADIEHKGCMYKQLKTLRGSGSLFHAKAVCGLLIITVMFAAQYALFILLGYTVGYQSHPDAAHYLLFYGLKPASNSALFLLHPACPLHDDPLFRHPHRHQPVGRYRQPAGHQPGIGTLLSLFPVQPRHSQ